MRKFIFALPKVQEHNNNSNNKKEKFHTLFFNMKWSIEINSNTVFMYYIPCTYDMYNYNIKYSVELFHDNKIYKFRLAFRKRNAWKIGTSFGMLPRRVEKLARRLAR